METKKIFDWNDMPDELREKLKKWTIDCGLSNDCYFSWSIVDEEDGPEASWMGRPAVREVNDWLIKNGAEKGEEVIIRHWW